MPNICSILDTAAAAAPHQGRRPHQQACGEQALNRRALLQTASRLAGLAAVQLHPAAHALGMSMQDSARDVQGAYDGFAGVLRAPPSTVGSPPHRMLRLPRIGH